MGFWQYIGETRLLNIRFSERKKNKLLSIINKSKIAKQLWSENHKFNCEGERYKDREKTYI